MIAQGNNWVFIKIKNKKKKPYGLMEEMQTTKQWFGCINQETFLEGQFSLLVNYVCKYSPHKGKP